MGRHRAWMRKTAQSLHLHYSFISKPRAAVTSILKVNQTKTRQQTPAALPEITALTPVARKGAATGVGVLRRQLKGLEQPLLQLQRPKG